MIRTLAIVLALSTSFVALSAMEASAQTTEQTDKSEEDWRKSKKKRDSSDIFEDILNRRSIGQGSGQYPQNPIDSLPEDSRRHLMKERAKVIAQSEPGTTPDAPYKPSEAAKTDPELAEQEKEAWDVIMTDMKGGGSQSPDQGQGGSGPNKIAVLGQGGGQNGSQGSGSDRSPSVMRGGSSQSVAEIMAQIKGLKSGRNAGTGTPPSQSPLGQGSLGQGSQGQAPQGQGSQGQDQSQAEAQAKADAAAEQAAQAQAQAEAASKAAAEAAAQAKVEAQTQAQARAIAQAEAMAHAETAEQAKQSPDPIGPLERIKRDREANSSGTETSASDFLKKSKNP